MSAILWATLKGHYHPQATPTIKSCVNTLNGTKTILIKISKYSDPTVCSLNRPSNKRKMSEVQSVQLLSIDFNSGQFLPKEDALALLSAINGKVRVISTVGTYRTGKSYILNRLAGQQHGFPLGHSQEGKTNGFWLMNLGSSTVAGEQVTTLLLDTQGLNDPIFANSARTSGLVFLAAALLSSCLLLNQVVAYTLCWPTVTH
jgi:hypothetical protein